MAEIKLPQASSISVKHGRILRGPHQFAFDLTNRCNFRCLHCFNLSGKNWIVKDELNDDEVLEFIRDVADLKPFNLCFCGGEPL
ncbi:MAG: 4Fe-4S cluster-binding domain-containing protein [bacterium]